MWLVSIPVNPTRTTARHGSSRITCTPVSRRIMLTILRKPTVFSTINTEYTAAMIPCFSSFRVVTRPITGSIVSKLTTMGSPLAVTVPLIKTRWQSFFNYKKYNFSYSISKIPNKIFNHQLSNLGINIICVVLLLDYFFELHYFSLTSRRTIA